MITRIVTPTHNGSITRWFKYNEAGKQEITTEVAEWIKENGYSYPFNDDAKFLFDLTFED